MSTFGSEFHKIWPTKYYNFKLTPFGKNLEKPNPNNIDINNFIEKSNNFPLKFATETCRVKNQPRDRLPIIEQQIGSAYPVIHELTLALYLSFLEHKSKYGNEKEKEVFMNLTLTDFVQRLLVKRSAAFCDITDSYLLLNHARGHGGFMEIGTDNEEPPLLLANTLSYDEIKLSALLSVSSHSEFINNGNHKNDGVVEEDKSKIERDGVVIGVIGARLCQHDVMEFQDIIISKTQNTKENGYGEGIRSKTDTRAADYRRLWKEFYDEPDFLYKKVKKNGKRFDECFSTNGAYIFDNVMMKKRYAISFDTLLLESEAKAAKANKSAYIHVVGVGLGVWRVAEQQEKIFLETFTERLNVLIEQLPHISVVHFSWFQLTEWGELKNGGLVASIKYPNGGIITFLSKRNPADKLLNEHENKLLIVTYAWDGGSLPGNEYWLKCTHNSSDSANASSTLVTELHNPHINADMVNGNNLHIATETYGVLHIAKFAQYILFRNKM